MSFSRAAGAPSPLKSCQWRPSSSSTCGGTVTIEGPLGFLAAGLFAGLEAAFVVLATSGPRMALLVDLEETRAGDVRVPLGGGHAGMAQELLYGSDVGASFQQVGRERVPESVGRDPASRQQTSDVLFHHRADIAFTEGFPSPIEE